MLIRTGRGCADSEIAQAACRRCVTAAHQQRVRVGIRLAHGLLHGERAAARGARNRRRRRLSRVVAQDALPRSPALRSRYRLGSASSSRTRAARCRTAGRCGLTSSRRRWRSARSSHLSRSTPPRATRAPSNSVLILLVALPLSTWLYERLFPNPHHRIVNSRPAPASMEGEGGGPKLAVLPSSARTNVGGLIPSNFFMDSETCGECHKDIYEQWKSSMHHFASFNNQFYRKSIEYMQDVVGTKPSKWCAGCHDHARVLQRPVRQARSRSRSTRPKRRPAWAASRATRSRTSTARMGNGGFTIEYPPLHDLASSQQPVHPRARQLPDVSRPRAAPPHVSEAVHAANSRPSSARPATRCTSTCR